MPEERSELVVETDARLDRAVCELLGVSRRTAHALIDSGAVRVNSKRRRKGDLVRQGDRLSIAPRVTELVAEPEIGIVSLYEDEAMVAIDKPAGLASTALRSDNRGTLANTLIAHFPETRHASPNPLEAGLAHRLDTGTSGVIVAARSLQAYAHLRAQFRRKQVHKEYRAVVEGRAGSAGTIDRPLVPGGISGREMRVASPEARGAQPAETSFRPIEHASGLTLLAVEIRTGVRHQIRAHLASIGHPVAGDALYGAAARERLFLHAAAIELNSPATDRPVRVASPLPDSFSALLGTRTGRRRG